MIEKGGIVGYITQPTRNEQVAVGTASIIVCDNRNVINKRSVLVIRNTSTGGQNITVSLGNSQAVANQGILLHQDETFTDSSETVYECFQGQIAAISSAAGGLLSIFER